MIEAVQVSGIVVMVMAAAIQLFSEDEFVFSVATQMAIWGMILFSVGVMM